MVHNWGRLQNKKIINIVANNDSVTLEFEEGFSAKISLYGACCSTSIFTDLSQFDELVGATIFEVCERHGESVVGLEDKWRAKGGEGNVLKWSFLVFTTNRGHTTIDWHNDSNGYYSGGVDLTINDPECLNCKEPQSQHTVIGNKCLYASTSFIRAYPA